MKFPLLIASIVFAAAPLKAVIITGFDSSTFTITSSDFTTTTQTATGLSISGSDFASGLFASLEPVTIGNVTSIYLTATQTSNLTSGFGIELFDSDGDSVIYKASWTSFPVNSTSTVALTLDSQVGTFNGTAVLLGFSAGGSPGNTLTVNFDELKTTASAVPEPSSFAALVGLTTLSIAASRRRRA